MKFNGKTMAANMNVTPAAIDDGVIEKNTLWSSKCIVDTLAPALHGSGSVVTCEPVAGYPLEVVSAITATQSGTGDPNPVSGNTRPISGHTAVKLTRGGKNLAKADATRNTDAGGGIAVTITNGSAEIVVNGTATKNHSMALFYGVMLPAGTYTVSVDGLNTGDYINGTSGSGQVFSGCGGIKSFTVNALSVVKIECVFIANTAYVNKAVKIQIEAGSAATNYEPYMADVFAVDLGQTVYGGTFNWANGELVITHNSAVMDGITAGRKLIATDKNATTYAYQSIKIDGQAFKVNGTVFADRAICRILNKAFVLFMPPAVSGVVDGDAEDTVVSKINAVLAGWHDAGTPLNVVFELAEPIVVQLTAQEVAALRGINTLFSDTGDTEVAGRADPAAVIEKLTSAIISLGGNV